MCIRDSGNTNQTGISGSEKNTTNNRMELMAPIMALKKIEKKSEITIYTDSKYVKDYPGQLVKDNDLSKFIL